MNNTTFDSLPLLLTAMEGKELLGAVYLDFNIALAHQNDRPYENTRLPANFENSSRRTICFLSSFTVYGIAAQLSRFRLVRATSNNRLYREKVN